MQEMKAWGSSTEANRNYREGAKDAKKYSINRRRTVNSPADFFALFAPSR
jgi:hypothetical protein